MRQSFAGKPSSKQSFRPAQLSVVGSKNQHWTHGLATPVLSGTYLCASLALLGLGQFFLAACLFAMWGITSPNLLGTLIDQMPQFKALRLHPFLNFTLMVGLAAGFLLGSGFFAPAQAIFLDAAEQGATTAITSLTGGATAQLASMIKFIFGALRLLLVIYMAIALIQIVNAARQGEEWKDLMRTPLMVILVVAVGDFIATVIFT